MLVNVGSVLILADTGIGNDFALVSVRPELASWVDPEIALIGGPCGTYEGSSWQVVARYGFMEDPDIHDILEACREQRLDVNVDAATFFLGRETLVATERPGMARWRERLFAFMSRNALRATAFYRIPANQVFEVGAQVEL